MSYRKRILSALLAAWFLSGLLAGAATSKQDDFRKGLKLFEQRNYKLANECFERSLRLCPADPNVTYYLAVSCQKSGKVRRAQQLFNHLMKGFPNTQAAELSRLFLEGQANKLSPTASATERRESESLTQLQEPHSVGLGDNAQLPAQQTIHFERHGDRLVIKAEINDRPLEISFDTGAPSTFITLTAFQSLNMQTPSGPPTGMVAGPSGELFPSWEAYVNVKVGNISRSHYPVVVVDNPPASRSGDDLPTLGQAFFGPYHYTIDERAKTITLTKVGSETAGSGVTASPTDPWAVPFTWRGRQMIVKAQVNGKPVEMLFDTASYYIALNEKTIRDLHLPMPTEAIDGGAGGTAGLGEFEVESIRLGPITQRNIHVVAMSDAALMMPLLGQPFFNDYRYTIDNEHNLIHFLKR